jgi:medium-chain acyl-[acyl-carrier-protein] hydrolase
MGLASDRPVAGGLETRSTPGRWLVPIAGSPEARLTLLCFPYAGGGASLFRAWPALLPAAVQVVGVQPPGRESRLLEPAFDALDPLLDALVAAVEPAVGGRFALFGHSLGALVAYELGRRMRRDLGVEPEWLFVAGFRAPHLAPRLPPLHELPAEQLVHELGMLGGTPAEVLGHPDLMRLVLPALRADLAVAETYRHEPQAVLRCPLSAFGGRRDDGVTPAELAAWRRCTSGPFSLRLLDGDHFFVHGCRRPLLASIAEDLRVLVGGAG